LSALVQRFREQIPFLQTNPYRTEKEHIKRKLEEKQSIGRGITAQELCAALPYQINTITARIKELKDGGKVYVFNHRECTEMNHDREVNAYKVTPLP